MTNKKKIINTLSDINTILSSKVVFCITRYNPFQNKIDDLDILVKDNDFSTFVDLLKNNGYIIQSHDQALGGRIPGAQVNLVKEDRLKIDLHKDFTWRRQRYINPDFIWTNLKKNNIDGVLMHSPVDHINSFLVLINIIFEKTYFKREDFLLLSSQMDEIFINKDIQKQIKEYSWVNSFNLFKNWWDREGQNMNSFPKFLPIWFVLYTYTEKFDVISFAYYIFFRIRYIFKKILPYD